jgi:hypothetical protein
VAFTITYNFNAKTIPNKFTISMLALSAMLATKIKYFVSSHSLYLLPLAHNLRELDPVAEVGEQPS